MNSLTLLAVALYLLSFAKRILTAEESRSRTSSVDTEILPYMNGDDQIPLSEEKVGAHEYYREYVAIEREASPELAPNVEPRHLEYRGQWIKLFADHRHADPEGSFETNDLFYMQAVYHSRNLLGKLVKYHELYPSEDIEKLIEVYHQMSAVRPSFYSFEMPSLGIKLPLSVRGDDFIKRIASVDENGNPVPIDNLILDASNFRSIETYSMQNVVDMTLDRYKPVPKDIFIKTVPRYYNDRDFEIRIFGQRYRLQTMHNKYKWNLAMQGSSNRQYLCVCSFYMARFGDAADFMLEENGWNRFHYKKYEF